MKQRKIWMALVTDDDEVVFSCACPSERKAEKAIVAHLRKEQDFDGKDINEAFEIKYKTALGNPEAQ